MQVSAIRVGHSQHQFLRFGKLGDLADRLYNSESVPVCNHWDLHEKRPRPPVPYLLQGIRHPSTTGIQTIRGRIRNVSVSAGARRSDGSPLVLLPHDCRRVFASEHLNNNTPVHVIQALLRHASPDTVMIYAKLYPSQLIEEYRKTVRSFYNAYYGEDGLKSPTAEEWAAHRRALSEGTDLPRLCAFPAEEKCGADLSTHAGQPRAQFGGCARSQRTCRTDRGSRDGGCQDQGSVAESRGIER
jgi:hypothetical protein